MPTTNENIEWAFRFSGAMRSQQDCLRKLVPLLLERIGWDRSDAGWRLDNYEYSGLLCRAVLILDIGGGLGSVKTSLMLEVGNMFKAGDQEVSLKGGGLSYLGMSDALYRDIMSKA